MSNIQAALSSLYDSLNGLFFRLASSNPQTVWVSQVMLRIGEIKQAIGIDEGADSAVATAYAFSGAASVVDASDAAAVEALLTDLQSFLQSL